MSATEKVCIPVVLTVAGSDSGGGAGIQADLKTFSALNVFGTSAITCVTAQNPGNVSGVEPVSADMVSGQIRAVCEWFPVAGAKTGMLYSGSIIHAVSKAVAECGITTLVVDPVMVATSGARLLREDALEILCSELLPTATVVTPNLFEAEILCGHGIESFDGLKTAAREISERFRTACVVKGGHLGPEIRGERSEAGNKVTDVLYVEGRTSVFSLQRVDMFETHGTGCTFSAALAAFLARGEVLEKAVGQAKGLVVEMLKKNAPPTGRR